MGITDPERQGTYFRIIRRVDDVLLKRHQESITAATAAK